MAAPRKYPDELRERATRLAVEARKDPAARTGAVRRIADQLDVHPEAPRTWVKRAETDDLPALVGDLHAVNSALESSGFGPQPLCSVVAFHGVQKPGDERRLGLVYLYKRGTFYPVCMRSGQRKRDNALELQVAAVLDDDLRIEKDKRRWFPLWDAPGL